MKKYTIVASAQLTVVETEVTKLLNEGWKLAGGIGLSYKHEHGGAGEHVPGHLVYAQALEKDSE